VYCVLDGTVNGGIVVDGIAWVWYKGCLVHVIYECFVVAVNLDVSCFW